MSDNKDEKKNLLPPIQGGQVYSNYKWTQDLFTALVTFDIPTYVTSKQIKVEFSKKNLKVGYLDAQQNLTFISLVNGELCMDCDDKECTWQMENDKGKKQLLIHLNKTAGIWWGTIMKGDPEIDINKLDAPTIRMDQLGAEARQTVEKMLYDQNAKAQGKPTTEELMKKEQVSKLQQQFPQFDFSKVDLKNSNFNFNGDK